VRPINKTGKIVVSQTIPDVIKEGPDDNHVLACALAGKANLIVSRDLDLVWLERYEGVGFMSPIDFEEGRDSTHCNRYDIELVPLYALRHLPIRIDPSMTVRPTLPRGTSHAPLDIPAPDVTVLQLIHALFWELSFFGTLEERDATREELRQQVKHIEAGEERLIPYEDIS
jgi:hypothetical protein